MKVVREGVEVEVPKKDVTLDEMRAYNKAAARRARERKREERERVEQAASPTLAQRLRAANRKDPATDEQLVEEFTQAHKREAENLYFAKCLSVHRSIATKLGIADALPKETLYEFTRRVVTAANEDAPNEAPIVWDIQIPDRLLGAV